MSFGGLSGDTSIGLSYAQSLADNEFTQAAEMLGRYVATQSDEDRADLQHVLEGWPREAFHRWLRLLHSSPELRAAQVNGHAWAPGGRMWQAAAPMRARLDTMASLRRSITTPADRHRAWLRREAVELVEEGASLRDILDFLDDLNEDAERGAKLSRREVYSIACRALEAGEARHVAI